MNLWKPSREAGLTLIELLITIAVLALVAAIAIPTITNVVSSTNNRAAAQQDSLVDDFVSKYTKTGVYTYDDATQTFTGYVDLNGDGTVDASEKIEELTVDTSKFTVTRTDGGDGVAPATTNTAASYDSIPDDSFTVALASGVALAAPSIIPVINSGQVYGSFFCDVEPGCTNDTALNVGVTNNTQQEGDATYVSYRVEVLEDPAAGSGSFSVEDFPTEDDWTAATVSTETYGNSFYLEGLDTTKRYFVRFALVSDAGTGSFNEATGFWYNDSYGDGAWAYTDTTDIGNNTSNITE